MDSSNDRIGLPTVKHSHRDAEQGAEKVVKGSGSCIDKVKPVPRDQSWDPESEIALLPSEATAALREALQKAPELVYLESDPGAFLEFHKGDAREATKKLSCYWSTRVEVLDDKAFFPLSFARKYCVLSAEDWNELRSGTMVPLPNDDEGNTVLFIDRSRQVCPPDLKVRLRAAFYVLSHCCAPLKKKKQGLVLIFSVSARTTFHSPVNDHLLRWIEQAFPVSLKQVHLAGCPPAKPARRIFENGIMRSATQTLAKHAKQLTTHVGMKKKDLLGKLKPFGLQADWLPQVVGGNWDYEVFHAWIHSLHEGQSDATETTQEMKVETPDDSQENASQEGTQQVPIEQEESSELQEQGNSESTPTEVEDSKPSAVNITEVQATRSQEPPASQAPRQREDQSSKIDDAEDRKLPARTTPSFVDRPGLAPPARESIAPTATSPWARAFARSLDSTGTATRTDQHEFRRLPTEWQTNQTQVRQDMTVARLSSDPLFNVFASAASLSAPFDRRNAARSEDSFHPVTGKALGLLSASMKVNPVQTTSKTQDRLFDPSKHVRPPSGALAYAAGRAAVANAMDLLPLSSKRAYLEALQYCPRLVEVESDAYRFLKCTDYDTILAAQRLASYWEFRKKLFGSRAFSPLIQCENGALSSQDIVLLSSGAIAILPPDDEGHSVVCLDRSRLLGRQAATVNDRLRAAFYLGTTLSEVEKNLTDGIVLVCVLITPRVLEIDDGMTVGLMEMSRKALPLKVKHVHFTACPPKSGKRATVDNMISRQLKLVDEDYQDRASLHVAETPCGILEKLRLFGLREGSLPPSVGGSWKYEDFNRFLRQQKESEQRADSSLLAMSLKPPAQSSQGEKVDRKERKRLLNIIHSRQKRERRRAEMERMSEERDSLDGENERLRSDNKRLENLLGEAQRMVKRIKKGDIPLDTTERSSGYGMSGPENSRPERTTGASNRGTMTGAATRVVRDAGLSISGGNNEHSALAERKLQAPRCETACFGSPTESFASHTLQQRQHSRQRSEAQIDPSHLALQRLQSHPQDPQALLLALLLRENSPRSPAPTSFPANARIASQPSYQDPLSNAPSDLLRSAVLAGLGQRMQGHSSVAHSYRSLDRGYLEDNVRASSQVSNARTLELLLQQQQAGNLGSIATAALSPPTNPQGAMLSSSLRDPTSRLAAWNHSLAHTITGSNATPAVAPVVPPEQSSDVQVASFLQALEQQQRRRQQHQQQQAPPPPPAQDPTNFSYPSYRRSL